MDLLFFLVEEAGFNWGEFALDQVAALVMTFIGIYLALIVQDYQDNKKERAQYVENLENFQAEIKKNLTIDCCQGFSKVKTYNDVLLNVNHLLDDISDDASSEKIEDWIYDAAETFEEFSSEYKEENEKDVNAFIEDVKHYKPVKLVPFYQRDIYGLYLASGVALAQKFAKDKNLASEIGGAYANMENIQKRIKELEDSCNKEFLPQYSGLMYVVNEFLEKVLPLLKEPDKHKELSDEDKEDIKDLGEELQEKLEDVGEIFSVADYLLLSMEDIEGMEKDLKTTLQKLLEVQNSCSISKEIEICKV